MTQPGPVKRTPRACEHCRQTRRRCEPPYPCRQCVAAGIPCNVRTKARPQRRQQKRLSTSTLQNSNDSIESVGIDSSNSSRFGHAAPQVASEARSHRCSEYAGQQVHSDTFELLKALVQDVLLERHGYVFDCTLVEPSWSEAEAAGSSSPSLTQPDTQALSPLSSAQSWSLLVDFQKFMGWQEAKLVDVEHLHTTFCALTEHLSDLSPSALLKAVSTLDFPVDSIALVFGALALGEVANSEFGRGRLYFNISTEMVKHVTGQSTLELSLAFFIQHVFALRVGTLSYAQGIIMQAIQTAHDIGLHHNTHGAQGLQLYLLIYMADQYCSLTHNTKPIIRTSNLQGEVFKPLSDAKPQLQTLIDLVTINGYVIEHSHQLPNPSQDDVLELESRIGTLCSRLIGPVPAQPSCGGFRTAYEPLARVHMLCCRLKLRVPGLSEQASWLPSLCICVHAAEGILSTYFQIYHPVLAFLFKQDRIQDPGTNKSSMPVAHRLATTWRQVKRIMMSAFVVVFAYWHGEMIHEEASRYMAMARLLLEYPRWRWGSKLDEALQILIDISSLSEFKLYEHTETLLPGANKQFLLRPSNNLQLAKTKLSAVVPDYHTDQVEMYGDTSSAQASWHHIFDAIPIDGLYGSDIPTFQNQTLFGLWENIDYPLENN